MTFYRIIYSQHPIAWDLYPSDPTKVLRLLTFCDKQIKFPSTVVIRDQAIPVDPRLIQMLSGAMRPGNEPSQLWPGSKIVATLLAPACSPDAGQASLLQPISRPASVTGGASSSSRSLLTAGASIVASLANPFLNWPKPSSS